MLVRILRTDTVIIIAASIQGQSACRVVPRRREVRVGAPQILAFPADFLPSSHFVRRHGTARGPSAATGASALRTPVAKFKL